MSTLRVDNLTDVAGNLSNFGIQGTARAWVNFNGTTVVTPASMTGVRASYNVSSITDNGVGNYTISVTNAFADANYSVVATASRVGDTTSSGAHSLLPATYTTSSVVLLSTRGTGTASDPDFVNVAIFR